LSIALAAMLDDGTAWPSVGIAPSKRRIERARSELRSVTSHDQAGSLQDLDVLRDRREGHLERLGEFVHIGCALREARKNRSPRRVGQCGERFVKPVFSDRPRHG